MKPAVKGRRGNSESVKPNETLMVSEKEVEAREG